MTEVETQDVGQARIEQILSLLDTALETIANEFTNAERTEAEIDSLKELMREGEIMESSLKAFAGKTEIDTSRLERLLVSINQWSENVDLVLIK